MSDPVRQADDDRALGARLVVYALTLAAIVYGAFKGLADWGYVVLVALLLAASYHLMRGSR